MQRRETYVRLMCRSLNITIGMITKCRSATVMKVNIADQFRFFKCVKAKTLNNKHEASVYWKVIKK